MRIEVNLTPQTICLFLALSRVSKLENDNMGNLWQVWGWAINILFFEVLFWTDVDLVDSDL